MIRFAVNNRGVLLIDQVQQRPVLLHLGAEDLDNLVKLPIHWKRDVMELIGRT